MLSNCIRLLKVGVGNCFRVLYDWIPGLMNSASGPSHRYLRIGWDRSTDLMLLVLDSGVLVVSSYILKNLEVQIVDP